MEQYEELREKLHHWTKGVFLITECLSSRDGKKQSIMGLSLTNEMGGDLGRWQSWINTKRREELANLGLPQKSRTFIGGPVSPEEPHVLFAVRTSKLSSPSPDYCWSVLHGADGEDLSVWYTSSLHASRALTWAGDAVVETRLYFGCACWDRVQLLGEIARGGWGLAPGGVNAWSQPTSQCWQSTVEQAIFAQTPMSSSLF
jgi:putative AlgH/UPF0301 family transcriptional regulator